MAIYAHWAAAVLYNGLARYEEAAEAARQATSNTFDYYVSARGLPELVEAASRAGNPGLAHDALGRLAEVTQRCGTDVALGVEARSRALLSYGTGADSISQLYLRLDAGGPRDVPAGDLVGQVTQQRALAHARLAP